MVSSIIIDAILKQAKVENKDIALKLFIEKLNDNHSYNDDKVNRILEIIINPSTIVKPSDINMEWVNCNYHRFVYREEQLIIKNFAIKGIDNIDGVVYFSHSYKEKVNEDRDDVDFTDSNISISFIDYPEMLKKS